MHLRRTLTQNVSINLEVAYTEAVSELLAAQEEYDKQLNEKSQEYTLAETALGFAWDALTATVDAYCARRIAESIELYKAGKAA